MITFDVYKHPVLGYRAVKQGFSWPALFFSVLWAFVKGIWGLGLVIFGVLLLLHLFRWALIGEVGDEGAALVYVLIAGVIIYVGFKANDWWRRDLENRGFKQVASLSAMTPSAAIAEAAELET